MKPSFDPTAHSEAMQFFRSRFEQADDDVRAVENATLPIFSSIPSVRLPQQVGSGVLLRIADQHFVLSATHVFDHVGEWALMLGRPARELMEPIGGERFVSGKQSDSSSDRLDASVFHVQSGLTESLRDVAITLDQVDRMHIDAGRSVFGAIGYFSNRSRTRGREARFKTERLLSTEYSDDVYATLNLDRATHMSLAYEDQVWVDGRWQTSPTPRGFSGGAIVRYGGPPLDPNMPQPGVVIPLLSGITIERKKERPGRLPGALVGTRVGFHLALIRRFLPGLEELEAWFREVEASNG